MRYLKILDNADMILKSYGPYPDRSDDGYQAAAQVYELALAELLRSGFPFEQRGDIIVISTDDREYGYNYAESVPTANQNTRRTSDVSYMIEKPKAGGLYGGDRKVPGAPEESSDPYLPEEVSEEEISGAEEAAAEDDVIRTAEADDEDAATPVADTGAGQETLHAGPGAGPDGSIGLPADDGASYGEEPPYNDGSSYSEESPYSEGPYAGEPSFDEEPEIPPEPSDGELDVSVDPEPDDPEEEADPEPHEEESGEAPAGNRSSDAPDREFEAIETEPDSDSPQAGGESAGSFMSKEDFTMSVHAISLWNDKKTDENGNPRAIAKTTLITMPLSIDTETPRIMTAIAAGDEGMKTNVSKKGKNTTRVDCRGIPLIVTGEFRDGVYSSSCSLSEQYAGMGYRLEEEKYKTYGSLGHIVLDDDEDDLYIHVFPIGFKNAAGKPYAHFCYLIENGNKEQLGSTVLTDGKAAFSVGGAKYNLFACWEDDKMKCFIADGNVGAGSRR